MTTIKKTLCLAVFGLILLLGSDVIAQDIGREQPESKIDAVMKMSGISPAVGVMYQVGSDSRLRGLGFISVNSFGTNDNYVLDLSYLKSTNWITFEGVSSYWGVNFHLQFEDPIIGPGLLVGSSYNLNDHFAIFGEVGLNAFIFDEGDNVEVGMLNSGIGLRLAL